MKRNLVITFAVLAATATLFSCQKEAEIIEKTEPATEKAPAIMTVNAGEIQTKTFLEADGDNYNVKWSAGDKIAAYEVGNGVIAASKTPSSELAADAASASFTMDFSGNTSLSANYSYLFVYPAGALSLNSEIYRGRIKWDQTFSATSFDKDADLMISEAVSDQATRPTSVNVGFARVGATVLMNLKAPTTSETIQSIEFSTTQGNIAGYVKVYPLTGTYDTDIYSGYKKITLTPATSTTYTGTIPVWFRCAAIDLNTDFTVTVHTTGKSYTKTVDLAAASKTIKFENAAMTKFNVDMTSAAAYTHFVVGTEITSIFPATKAGVKFSNAQGTGSTAPFYASPYNWYKNSDVTISAGTTGNITKVVFNFGSLDSEPAFTNDDDDSSFALVGTTGTWTVGTDPVTSVTFTNTAKKATISSFDVFYTGTPNETVVASMPTIAFANPAIDVAMGGTRTNVATTNYNNGTITYASLDETKATVNSTTGEITPVAPGVVTIRATIAGASTAFSVINSNTADCTVTVTAPATYDVLNYTLTGVAGESYEAWVDKNGSYSDAVYAGTSGGKYSSIQLNSGSPRGIISTTSGGYVSNVTVSWNSNTSNGRTLQVYGKNSPYSGSGDLAAEATRGTLIGTIVKGTSTSLDAADYYEYLGLYGSDGAMYLDEIRVTWGAAKTRVATPTSVTATPSGTSINVSWTDASDANIGKYLVTCTGQTAKEINPGVQSASFTGLSNGNYDVTIQAVPSDVTLATGSRAYSTIVTVEDVAITAAVEEVWKLTPLADITTSDVFVIASGSYAMTNNNGTSSAPAAVSISTTTVGLVTKLTGTVTDNMKWNLTKSGSDYTFYPDGDDKTWLYCNTTASSSSNNNMRVGTGARKVFELSGNKLLTNDTYTDRYLSLYSSSDWRGYTSGGSDMSFYVLQ